MASNTPTSTLSEIQLMRICGGIRADADVLDSLIGTLQAAQAGGIFSFNAKSYGATADGSTDDRVAIQAAVTAAAAAGGGIVVFPAGTYLMTRSGAAWSLDITGDNVTLMGIAGRSVIKHQAGIASVTAIVRCNERTNVLIDSIAFDGNWGNSVGGTDSQTGLNHTTQADPKNYGIWARGSTNLTVKDCTFNQIYGDAIWFGGGANTPALYANNNHVIRCAITMCARNAISIAGYADGISIRDCTMDNFYTTGIDVEPQGALKTCRNIIIDNCTIGRWWAVTVARPALSLGGASQGCHEDSAIRGCRISNCRIAGFCNFANVIDCSITKCRITLDFSIAGRSPIYVDQGAINLLIDDVYIYDRAGASADHVACIAIRQYTTINRPSSVTIRNGDLHPRNGMYGISLDGTGGAVAQDTGTATSQGIDGSSRPTLTDSSKVGGAAWVVDAYKDTVVRMGGATAVVETNTVDTLTMTAWVSPLGVAVATPSNGAFVIMARQGLVTVQDTKIDCGNDGYTAGGFGMYIDDGNPSSNAMRVRIKNLFIKNATTDGINIKSRGVPITLLEFDGVYVMDDQLTPTCTTGIRFQTSPSAANIGKLIMRNITVDGVATMVAGVGTAAPNVVSWIVEDGPSQRWEGYGAPTVTAPKGSQYRRLDGGAGTSFYVNEAGTGTWVAK